jgi:hypothetical protein
MLRFVGECWFMVVSVDVWGCLFMCGNVWYCFDVCDYVLMFVDVWECVYVCLCVLLSDYVCVNVC